MVGLGLLFGLRGSSAVDAPASQPTPSPSPDVTTAATTPKVNPTPKALPTPVSREIQERVNKEAASRLEKKRKAIVATCWEPSMQAEPEPASLDLQVRAVFDAEGRAHAFGAHAPDARRSDVAGCVGKLDRADLAITPPGMEVGALFVFRLP